MLLIVRCLMFNIDVEYFQRGGLIMITAKLGERIRQIRLGKGISQEKFALSIEMDRTYYASVEKGKRNISIINIEKIAKGLEITLEELFKGI